MAKSNDEKPKKIDDVTSDKPKDATNVAPVRSATEQTWIDALEAKSKADDALDAAASALGAEKHAAKSNAVKGPDGKLYRVSKNRQARDGTKPRHEFRLEPDEIRL
jgi:hypothetical protein